MVPTVHTNHFDEILTQISDPKIKFSTKPHFFEKWPRPKGQKYDVCEEKNSAGKFHRKTKVVNTFPNIPDPNRTKLYLKNMYFYNNFVGNIGSSIKIAKKNIKLLPKRSYLNAPAPS